MKIVFVYFAALLVVISAGPIGNDELSERSLGHKRGHSHGGLNSGFEFPHHGGSGFNPGLHGSAGHSGVYPGSGSVRPGFGSGGHGHSGGFGSGHGSHGHGSNIHGSGFGHGTDFGSNHGSFGSHGHRNYY